MFLNTKHKAVFPIFSFKTSMQKAYKQLFSITCKQYPNLEI